MKSKICWAMGYALYGYLSVVQADADLWQDIQQHAARSDGVQQRLLHLDETALGERLTNSPQSDLQLPLPDGGFVHVQLIEEPLLAPHLAAQHPEIRTFRLEGIDDPAISGRAELTALGFHAMLTLADGDTLYIDPGTVSLDPAARSYRSLGRRANADHFNTRFSCETREALPATATDTASASPSMAQKMGESLHTYDIAIAASGEYTAYYQGSKTAALSAIVTTLNRINQIYVRDLSIQLRLVSGTETIFTDAASDPYSGSSYADMSANQTVLDQLIGNSNYDIGHLFTTGNGGLSIVKAACDNGYKAQGISGWDSPEGDIFNIDFVAHELGHQFGATHTFNSTRGSCSGSNRIGITAFEPGSGSTIMAYAGICAGDNLQINSDAMFHAGSISQINDYAHQGKGGTCADISTLNNSNPVVNAGADYTIPARTPFELTGSATDSNNHVLSYSWEQMDAGAASAVDVDTGDNALVRDQLPSSSPRRTIPRLSDLMSGVHTYGETLPSKTRSMKFRLQVRDGKGGVGYDDMQLSVYNTGDAFAVTSPAGSELTPSSVQSVVWNVANTDRAPISCARVDIAINVTGNEGDFQPLLNNTDNDGAASVTLPATLGAKNTIRVKCSNNIFFALSNTKATASSTGSGNTSGGSSGNTDSGTLPSSGGGGSFPPGLILLGGLLLWFRSYLKD